MDATNMRIVREAIADYHKKMEDDVEKRCRIYCNALCEYAIEFRNSAGGHNYTGNLLNSIVVCLYKNRQPIFAEYAAEYIPKAIQVKMTAPKHYHFTRDYDGEESDYHAEIQTDEGWGEEDARKFFNSYRPEGKNLFDIVVAYPVEYAGFIEEASQATGIMELYAHTEKFGINFLQIPKVA